MSERDGYIGDNNPERLCEWCGHAITDDWPAVLPQDPSEPPIHFHDCSRLPTEGFPHRA